MPQPRQRHPSSLRKISIENIVCHFEDVWCSGCNTDSLELCDQSDIFTPFQYICDDMIQEIIDMLFERKLLRRHHFQVLLHSNIRRLDLSEVLERFWSTDERYIIKTLSSRCQKLTHLKLGRLACAISEIMCMIIRNLPQIVSLCLKKRTLIAKVMKAISENCPNLQELDVFHCELEGGSLTYLCNYPEDPKARPKLKKLFVCLRTNDTVNLLKNQTSLLSLGNCDLIDRAFDQMYGEEFLQVKEVPPEWVHNLMEIIINRSSGWGFHLGEIDRLNLTFQCCPFLTKLTLIHLREGESINNVAKLKHLKTLLVSMFWKDDFSKYLAPLLSEIGANLIYLRCGGFDNVSLILIGQSCRRLESLVLYDVSLASEKHPIDGDVTHAFPYFANLEVLDVNKLTYIDTNVLSLLVQNAAQLVHYEFKNVTNMTDRVICEANRKHGFRHLRTCYFTSCSPISVESLWALSPDNPLEILSVFDCKDITSQDINLVRQEAELRQFNIDINWIG